VKSANLLYESEDTLLPHLVEACPDAIIGVNSKGIVIIFNPAAALLTRHPVETALGKMHIAELYGNLEIAKTVKAAIYSKKFGGQNRLNGYETEIVDSSGRHIPIRLSAALLIENGQEAGSVGFFHDLTHQKKLEEKLRNLSITDGLTGLYNQRHFHSSLSDELLRARRHSRNLSVIGFDLDKFKQCNDRFGHLEGDNVLRLIGDILHTETRKSDMSFRYGGDEFFVLLPETNREQALNVAEKIRRVFNERWPFDSKAGMAGDFRVTLSMGVIQYTDEKETTELIKRLDILIYSAKKEGGDRIASHVEQ
jgi:diguanylate cyclase (GGDEF)-like protein/PAS domain S-box-containing protein